MLRLELIVLRSFDCVAINVDCVARQFGCVAYVAATVDAGSSL